MACCFLAPSKLEFSFRFSIRAWKVKYGIVTLTFSISRASSISNCDFHFRFSALSSIWRAGSKMKSALLSDLSQDKLWQISFLFSIWEWKFQNRLSNATSVFQSGSRSSKTNVKYNFHFSIWNGSSKTNTEKWGVVNDNSFWIGDDDGMVQKYTDPCRLSGWVCLFERISKTYKVTQ